MKKALIVQGGWDGHEPVQVSEIFANLLKKENYNVEVYDNLDILKDEERVAALDLFVPVWTMGQITDEQLKPVMKAVENGTGIAGCHGGMCDAFRDSVDWQFMCGGNWVSHPGNDGTDYIVNIKTNSSSPIIAGMQDFKVKSEQYYLHVDPVVDVLATTRFPVADGPHAANGVVDMPVVWTKMWGKGRVFYNSLGHVANIFDIPEALELMRRGFLWASK